jgi:hypothetical protein
VRLISVGVVLLAATAATAAFAEERLAPSGADDGEVLRGDVLVWADATFYTDTAGGAPTVHAARLDGARKDRIGAVIAMHVVSVTKDGFVEVESAREPDCAWAQLATSDDVTRVRLFVRRADLAPMLTQPFEQTFDDGTHVALRPGVALIPTADHQFVVGIRGGALVAAVPATSVGHSYAPERTKAAPAMIAHDYELAPNTRITLGGQTLHLDAAHATALERRGATTLFQIRTRCAALDVAVATKAVREVEDEDDEGEAGGDAGLSVLSLRDHDYIPAGTVLSTAAGHAVAVAAKPMYLAGAPHGKTACVDRRVRVIVDGDALDVGDDEGKLRVCAPAAAAVHERMRSASSANGATGR